jgi:predicted transcriptional regulator
MAKTQEKEYSMEKGEKTLLENQNNLRSQYEYMASLIHRDMYVFVNGVIRKRLGISEDMEIVYNLDTGKIYASPKVKKEEKAQ